MVFDFRTQPVYDFGGSEVRCALCTLVKKRMGSCWKVLQYLKLWSKVDTRT